MISVVIATDDSECVLVPTLAALVPGALAGIVREVIVADGGSTDATAKVADVAGCRFVAGAAPIGERLKSAAALARAQWLMFLKPGVVLDAAWIDEATHFIQQADGADQAAVFRPAVTSRRRRSALAEALAQLATALTIRTRPAPALLISKRRYHELGGHSSDGADPGADLLQRLGRRQIVMLRCGAKMVEARA
jgi:glycosyltransferase involved in cell wall biosynthesis